ncbi:MAG TPA: VWA domain-containing protein [Bryobacteraceae bacterium]|jgi:hypothetical protein
MFFLNLTAGEFFVLLGTLAGLITALYLLDRMKRRKIVSTLRFWMPALTADEQQSRRRMREPWSFVLQLLSLLVLLLAIAQLQWGTRQRRGHDSVLLLDTSAWTAEKEGQGTLLDREKGIARQYLAGLGTTDRLMIVRADTLATPVVGFSSDRARLERAVNESLSSFSALNLEQALTFASHARAASGGSGEIVYIGPGLAREAPKADKGLTNLRVVRVDANRRNCGIRRIGVKPREDQSGWWDAAVTLRNYGSDATRIRLHTQFAGTDFAPRAVDLPANQERTVEYTFETDTAGVLAVEIEPHDELPRDDRAQVWLPRNRALRLAVFTERPEVLRPLVDANRRLNITIASGSQYNAKPPADVMLLDQMAPPYPPQIPSLWIAPPREASPVVVKAVVLNASLKRWDSSNLLGAALYAKETQLPSAEVFETSADDIVAGNVKEGPVVVARPERQRHERLAVIGFDPLGTELRFQVTTPLLFAGLTRWLAPQAFRLVDATADPAGAATVSLDPGEPVDRIRVTDESGGPIPFTVRDHTVQIFAARPSLVRIASEYRDRILSLTLPDVADVKWTPPVHAAEGLPPAAAFLPSAIDLWKWLAILGAALLVLEWKLYGARRAALKILRPSTQSPHRSERTGELVSR